MISCHGIYLRGLLDVTWESVASAESMSETHITWAPLQLMPRVHRIEHPCQHLHTVPSSEALHGDQGLDAQAGEQFWPSSWRH